MTGMRNILLATSVLAASVLAGAAMAEDFSGGNKGGGAGASREMAAAPKAAKSGAPIKMRSADAAMRALPDNDALVRAFGVTKRSADGKIERMDAMPRVIDMIRSGGKAGKMPKSSTAKPDDRADASREVIGDDTREQVADSTTYPYDTVGFVQATSSAMDEPFNCTGALIGPRLVVTAARCIFDHGLEGGWVENVSFWPGINGENNIPFGSYEWADAYILNGYIDDYDGTYDSIWPYDMALIVLNERAGDDLGWLGYAEMDNSGVILNTVGYQSDKEFVTQWRTDCEVPADNIRDYDFDHGCDADSWSVGAPLYLYDDQEDRYVMGINMGAFGDANWGLKIDGALFEWIDSVNQELENM